MSPCGCFLWDCAKNQQGNKRTAVTPCSIGVLKDQSCPWGLGIEKCFFLLFGDKPWPLYLLPNPNHDACPVIIRTVKLKVRFLS